MKRRDFLQFGSAAAGLTIAGVPLQALAQGRKGGNLNAIVQPEPVSVNMAVVQNGPAQLVGGNITEGLLRYDADLKPMPLLAVSWTPNAEKTSWTFKLKQDVKWHDGKPFTSEDVVFSMDVFLRKMHERARTYLDPVSAIVAVDPLTVRFDLKYPYAAFLNIFEAGSMPMVPKHLYEGTDFATNPANAKPIGTGPFKFKEWVKGSYIYLEANKEWHEPGLPEIAGVYFQIIPDAASRAQAFESGKVDLVPGGGVEYFHVGRLAKLPDVEVTTKGWELTSPQCFLWLNNRNKPFDDVKFRQAVLYTLDREAMAKVAFYGFAKPATGPFNSHINFYSNKVKKYPRDVEAAKKLVAQTSYKGETLRLMPLPYGEAWQRMAEIARQNLLQAGIKTELVATDTAGWLKRLGDWDYDMSFTYVYQYGDPALGVQRNYTSANIAKGPAFNNVEGFSDPDCDRLFDAGRQEADPAKRREIYQKVQDLLLEKVPVAWLLELNFPTLYRKKIGNLMTAGSGLNDGLGRITLAD